jgi:hypothetical protein
MLAALIYLDGRGIVLIRGKDKRQDIYQRMLSHIETRNKRICFWPEGTRLSCFALTLLKGGLASASTRSAPRLRVVDPRNHGPVESLRRLILRNDCEDWICNGLLGRRMTVRQCHFH